MATTPEKSPKIGFDNEAYIKAQTASILERVDRYQEKLYIEFGGKIMYDYHASRVLPAGFSSTVRVAEETSRGADRVKYCLRLSL